MLTPNPPEVNLEGRYSVTETASALSLSKTTVRKYINSGELKCQVHSITGKKYVMGNEIMAFWRGDPLRRRGL